MSEEIVEEEVGVKVTIIPMKKRIIKGLAGFIPVSTLAIISLFGGEMGKFAFYLIAAGVLGAWLYSKKEIRTYEGEYIDSTGQNWEKTRVFNYSIEGMQAKVRDEAKSQEKWDVLSEITDKLLANVWVRYFIAIWLAVIAFWLSTVVTSKAGYLWVFIIGCYSVVLAKELIVWIIGAAIVIGIGAALLGALSSVSIPIAIIIGAVIIASAVRK